MHTKHYRTDKKIFLKSKETMYKQIYYDHALYNLILLKCQFSGNYSIDLIIPVKISAAFLREIDKLFPKLDVREAKEVI